MVKSIPQPTTGYEINGKLYPTYGRAVAETIYGEYRDTHFKKYVGVPMYQGPSADGLTDWIAANIARVKELVNGG